jgi:hypothetical protein
MQVGNFGFGDSGSGGGGGTPIVGGGTLNYVSKFTPNGTTINNSLLFDNGTSVGLGTITPDASALLDLSSTTQGFAAPRMTTLQRDAIVAPIVSLLIFNTSSGFYNYWDGSTWIQMDTSTGGDVSGSGTTNYAVKWTDGANSVIGDGTWAFSGNDYYPVTTGSNIGDATHRIGTIFMASIFDYANDLTFFNGTATTATLTTTGNFGIGISPTYKLDILSSNLNTLRIHADAVTNNAVISSSNQSTFLTLDTATTSILGSVGSNILLRTAGVSYGSFFTNSSNTNTTLKSDNGYWLNLANSTTESIGLGQGGNFMQFNMNGVNNMILVGSTGNFGVGTNSNPTARIYALGVDNTLANYTFKADDSLGNPLLYVRNDSKVSIGKATTLTTLDILGDTTNTLFKLNNANFAFADKLRIDNNGSFYSTSINNFGVGGAGSLYTDHYTHQFNASGSPYLYFTNHGGVSNLYGYGIIGGAVVLAEPAYRLKIYQNEAGNILRLDSIATGTANDGFDGYMYGINLTSSGIFSNSGSGTFYKVGLNVDVSNGDVNYAALFNGGNSGFGILNPTATIHIQGIDNTLANYAFKADDSLGNPLLYVRNDSKVSIGKATTLTTLDILGDTTNTLFKLNNANFAFADKLRVDNNGSFYSGSINAFGGFGTGTYTTDHLNYTLNTSFSTYLAFTNAGGAGNKTSYGIIGGAIGSADSDYRLVILNSDTSTISGSGLKVLSTGASIGNDGFDYYNYGVNINSSGVFTNSGSGTSYKIGLNVNVSNGEVNYAALFNGGNSGFGILNPTATIHIQGVDSTLANYAFKVDNSLGNPLLYVRNDGVSTFNTSATYATNFGYDVKWQTFSNPSGSDGNYISLCTGGGSLFQTTFSRRNGGVVKSEMYFIEANDTTYMAIGVIGDANKALALRTNDLDRLFISHNGDIGVSKNAMSARLHVFGVDAVNNINQRLEPVTNVTEDTTGNTVVTTDSTANVTAQTIAIPTNKVVSLESTIVYRKTAGAGVGVIGDGTLIKLNSSVKNIAGVLTLDIVQNTYSGITNAIAGVSANYIVSGTNILVAVTGVLNDDITWNVITKINTVA